VKVPGRLTAWLSVAILAVLIVTASVTSAWSAPKAASNSPAQEMLDAVVVPAGAQQVSTLPGGVFSQPFEQPGCSPLIDNAREWELGGEPQNVAAFLVAHPPPGIPNTSRGWAGNGGVTTSYDVADTPSGPDWTSNDQLAFTIAALGDGRTGIRADAEVVPAGAICMHH
jgi:hypothetical protein